MFVLQCLLLNGWNYDSVNICWLTMVTFWTGVLITQLIFIRFVNVFRVLNHDIWGLVIVELVWLHGVEGRFGNWRSKPAAWQNTAYSLLNNKRWKRVLLGGKDTRWLEQPVGYSPALSNVEKSRIPFYGRHLSILQRGVVSPSFLNMTT